MSLTSRAIQMLRHCLPANSALTPTGVNSPVVRVLSIFWTHANLRLNRSRNSRRLEIGPGPLRLPGFETLNVLLSRHVDYVCDASRRLPFESGTFALVYASHVLEHTPWYLCAEVLAEWVRILAPGGVIEIWVPDGLKICRAFADAESEGSDPTVADNWLRFNEAKDPCRWASGRIFAYGDGHGRVNDPNWHRALFSPRYLRALMAQAGLTNIEPLDRSEVRGHDHGWINLGMRGTKG